MNKITEKILRWDGLKMNNELSRRFYDKASLERSVNIASKQQISRVDAAHLFALLNGASVHDLHGAQGKLCKKYYNMIYALMGNECGPSLNINDVLSAYNKKFWTHITLQDLLSLQFDLTDAGGPTIKECLQVQPFVDFENSVKSKEAYCKLFEKFDDLKLQYVSLLKDYNKTRAELEILKLENKMLEDTKSKLIETFKNQM